MAPKGKPTLRGDSLPAQRFRHRGNVLVLSPPQCRGKRWLFTVALRANTQASPAPLRLQQFENAAVVKERVVVMHQLRVKASKYWQSVGMLRQSPS